MVYTTVIIQYEKKPAGIARLLNFSATTEQLVVKLPKDDAGSITEAINALSKRYPKLKPENVEIFPVTAARVAAKKKSIKKTKA